MTGSEIVQSPHNLLELAIEKGAGVKQLEKLMDLKERYEAQEARKAFFESMTMFQSKCPVLQKSKTVDFELNGGGTINYKYTPLGDIAKQIKKVLKDSQLSYRWEIEDNEKGITVTCIVSHKDGHNEKTTMMAQPDDSGKKNKIQQRGSTITYLQRYTLIGALGISSADEDVDGAAAKKPEAVKKPDLNPDSDKWQQAVDGLVNESVNITQIKKHYKLTKENEELLWKNVNNLRSSK